MKRILGSLLVLMLLLLVLEPSVSQTPDSRVIKASLLEDEQGQIHALFSTLEQGIRQGDVKRIRSCFVPEVASSKLKGKEQSFEQRGFTIAPDTILVSNDDATALCVLKDNNGRVDKECSGFPPTYS